MTNLEQIEHMLKSAGVQYETIRNPSLNVIEIEISNSSGQGDRGVTTNWYFGLDGSLSFVENWAKDHCGCL